MQVAESSLNPFYNYGDDDDEDSAAGLNTSSRMFAYSSNMSGIFEHLKLQQRRDSEESFEIAFNSDNPALAPDLAERNRQRELELDPIEEQPNDETDPLQSGMKRRRNEWEVDSAEISVGDAVEDKINAPLETFERRNTVMTEMTLKTEDPMLQDESSEEYGERENPPWVDRVKLRHGMDWLDLIKQEVDKKYGSAHSDVNRFTYNTQKTEKTQ